MATPYVSREGKQAVKQLIGVREEEDGRSERHPVVGWIGVAPTGNMTHAKAGRRPSGLASPESLANLLRRESR